MNQTRTPYTLIKLLRTRGNENKLINNVKEQNEHYIKHAGNDLFYSPVTSKFHKISNYW